MARRRKTSKQIAASKRNIKIAQQAKKRTARIKLRIHKANVSSLTNKLNNAFRNLGHY